MGVSPGAFKTLDFLRAWIDDRVIMFDDDRSRCLNSNSESLYRASTLACLQVAVCFYVFFRNFKSSGDFTFRKLWFGNCASLPLDWQFRLCGCIRLRLSPFLSGALNIPLYNVNFLSLWWPQTRFLIFLLFSNFCSRFNYAWTTQWDIGNFDVVLEILAYSHFLFRPHHHLSSDECV